LGNIEEAALVDERYIDHDANEEKGLGASGALFAEEAGTQGESGYAAEIHARNEGQRGRDCVMKKHR
jgi:hypothetical protein